MKPMEHGAIVELVKGLERAYIGGEADAFAGLHPITLHGLGKDHRDCYRMGYERGMVEWEQGRGERHPHRGAI